MRSGANPGRCCTAFTSGSCSPMSAGGSCGSSCAIAVIAPPPLGCLRSEAEWAGGRWSRRCMSAAEWPATSQCSPGSRRPTNGRGCRPIAPCHHNAFPNTRCRAMTTSLPSIPRPQAAEAALPILLRQLRLAWIRAHWQSIDVTPFAAPVLMRASGVIKPLSIAGGLPGAYVPGEPNAVCRRCTRSGAALPTAWLLAAWQIARY